MNLNTYDIVASIKGFFNKHHIVLYIVAASIFMSVIIYILYTIFMTASAPTQTQPVTIGNFDEKTILQIKRLHDSSSPDTTFALPSPRSSPFAE